MKDEANSIYDNNKKVAIFFLSFIIWIFIHSTCLVMLKDFIIMGKVRHVGIISSFKKKMVVMRDC